jgi:hypothetical protein
MFCIFELGAVEVIGKMIEYLQKVLTGHVPL